MSAKINTIYEAENATLGAVLINEAAMQIVREILGDSPCVFEDEAHRSIYEAMIALHKAGDAVDPITLKNALAEARKLDKVGGVAFIADLASDVPASANVDHYARIVRDASQRRVMQTLTRKTMAMLDNGEPIDTLLDDWERFIELSRSNGAAKIETVCMADVEAERVEWIWENRIPRGKLTVLDGDPGVGKSTITMDMAARISRGRAFPDGGHITQPAGVVLVGGEDGLGDTVRPRLEAAGGDLNRINAIESVPSSDGTPRPISLPLDIPHIEAAIIEADAALVIIDPLMAFLGSGIDSHKDQDIRRVLHALAAMAERTGAGVLIVRHLNKSSGGNVIYRGGGSIGIIAAARVGLLAAKHPKDDGKCILAITKCNLSPQAAALDYVIDADPDRNVSRIKWGYTNQYRAKDLISEPAEGGTAVDEAMEFLRDCLCGGPVGATEVQRQARDAGVSKITLRRAQDRLKVKPRKEGRPGESGRWMWELPENREIQESAEDAQQSPKMLTRESERLREKVSTFDSSPGMRKMDRTDTVKRTPGNSDQAPCGEIEEIRRDTAKPGPDQDEHNIESISSIMDRSFPNLSKALRAQGVNKGPRREAAPDVAGDFEF